MRSVLPLLLSFVGACVVDSAASESPLTCSGEEADACLGLGPQAEPAVSELARTSVQGTPLAACSTEPMTGFFRDGQCRTGPEDRGVHVVCAEVDSAFLVYTAARGNDLSTPRPGLGFAGLTPGDRWCLCAARWEEARRDGVAPAVVLGATHPAALRSTTRQALEAHAVAERP